MSVLGGSVSEVGVWLRRKVVSAVEVCEAAIERQTKVEGLKAYTKHTHHTARQAARRSHLRYEQNKPLGPLDGIPVAVKDNFCTQGIPTTCGSKMLENYTPPYNATVVQRLLSAGAVLMGKTNLDEFAMGSGTLDSSFGHTKNIYRSGINYELGGVKEYPTTGLDEDWIVAGGSSGGSAVAVATGTAYVSLGSDTGGSVRNPAAYCGIVGLKPSYGVVPRWGLVSLVNSMDAPGLMGRCVDDVAALLSVVAGRDEKDCTSVPSTLTSLQLPEAPSLKGLVVGVPREYHWPGMSEEVVEAWTKVADMMEAEGIEVREVSMPNTQYSIICYSILNPCEVASNFTRYTGVGYGHREATGDKGNSMEGLYSLTRRMGLNEVVRSRVLAGNYFLLRENRRTYFEQALKVRRLIWQDFQDMWRSGVSLLLTPTTLTPPYRYSDFSRVDNRTQTAKEDICTQAANMAGISAISLPVSLNKEGLPVSVQLMAPWCQDKELLTAAKWVEQRVTFPRLTIL